MMIATDEAIILAGGMGTRLRSIVSDVPKPLAPVAGRPFLAWLLDMLAEQGMRRVILATGYMADRIAETCGTRWRGMTIAYSREPQPLGTGGAIALAASHVQGNRCFVLNGDTWMKLDYAAFDERSRASGSRLSMALAKVADVSRYGAVEAEDERVAGFREKGEQGPGYINAGVYCIETSLLHAFPESASFSFEQEVLVPAVVHEHVLAYTRTDEFIDIGVPEDYQRAQSVLSSTRHAGNE